MQKVACERSYFAHAFEKGAMTSIWARESSDPTLPSDSLRRMDKENPDPRVLIGKKAWRAIHSTTSTRLL